MGRGAGPQKENKMLTRLYIKTQSRIREGFASGDRGQGTLEYLGVVIIVVLLVGLAIAGFKAFNLDTAITEQLEKIGQ